MYPFGHRWSCTKSSVHAKAEAEAGKTILKSYRDIDPYIIEQLPSHIKAVCPFGYECSSLQAHRIHCLTLVIIVVVQVSNLTGRINAASLHFPGCHCSKGHLHRSFDRLLERYPDAPLCSGIN